MNRTFLLVPVSGRAQIDTIARALQQSLEAGKTQKCVCVPDVLPLAEAERIVAREGWNGWLVDAVEKLRDAASGADVLVASAPAPSADHPFASRFNRELIRALDAEVILVADLAQPASPAWREQIALAARLYADGSAPRSVSCVLRVRPAQGEPADAAFARIRQDYSAPGHALPELVALVPEAATLDSAVRHLAGAWLDRWRTRSREPRVSPAAFYARLTHQARAVNRRIVLPESTDPRTVHAAAVCAQRGIARCVLLGDPAAIKRVAGEQGVELPAGVEIMDAGAIRPGHVETLVRLRGPGQISGQEAAQQLQDDGVFATVLLASGQVDGLVSGAVHSSAATVRAALQIVGTRPAVKRASSVFFMGLPEQVLVYGDCAVNPDPDAETLAEIAIQSADTAVRFGLPARVALLSYATEKSGSGPDVDKVRSATRLAQSQRPDLAIDGPLQYDAAAVPEVARGKAPDSAVAGRATVYIFPDLDTGNVTYKAVQRSTGITCIGPVLQGLRRPVSDLSRGASVEDIVYTIAATVVQAAQE